MKKNLPLTVTALTLTASLIACGGKSAPKPVPVVPKPVVKVAPAAPAPTICRVEAALKAAASRKIGEVSPVVLGEATKASVAKYLEERDTLSWDYDVAEFAYRQCLIHALNLEPKADPCAKQDAVLDAAKQDLGEKSKTALARSGNTEGWREYRDLQQKQLLEFRATDTKNYLNWLDLEKLEEFPYDVATKMDVWRQKDGLEQKSSALRKYTATTKAKYKDYDKEKKVRWSAYENTKKEGEKKVAQAQAALNSCLSLHEPQHARPTAPCQ